VNKPHVFISAKESAEVSQEVMRRGREFLATMDDQQILALDGKYLVRSSNGQTYYLVDLNASRCDCPDYFYRQQECKHQRAAKEFRGRNRAKSSRA